jgi:hypothetical protein
MPQAKPSTSYLEDYYKHVHEDDLDPCQTPDMLLLNAVQHDHPDRVRLVKMLLRRRVPLQELWPDTGETALHMAVQSGDAQVRRTAFDHECRNV